MKKKRKLKKKVIVLIVLIIILVLLVTGFVIYKNLNSGKESVKVVDEIPEYGYTLENDQPKVYKDLFKQLVKVLNKETVDYDKYASLISQMFAIDFYNLNNKDSKNDVGGLQFVYTDKVDNFSLKASDTVYKYIKNNFDKKRVQKLPEVTESKLISIENSSYKYKDINDEKSYTAKVELSYKEDLDYPKNLTIKLLHNGKKLEVYYME